MKFNRYNSSLAELTGRAQKILNQQFNPAELLGLYKRILGLIDLTTLNGDDTTEKVTQLCQQAVGFENKELGTPKTAAVCVYPVFAQTVSKALHGTGIQTACVAGAFPSGQSPLNARILEVSYAVENGADEIDMVISRGRLLEGDTDYVLNEIKAHKEACAGKHLKVILETGELKTPEMIRKACELAIEGGADFLKTSTGKITPAATHEAVLIMLDTIKEYYKSEGKMLGIKPAGGISTPGEALNYYLLVQAVLGEKWLNNRYFRIGASRLAGNLYEAVEELATV
ncbi:deoxyribose-phosphate aldolase [Candidatus Sulfidibacterium hydrothermale]|uniref:deoxyribose-phosphate aldolase n=1 Tax=Candidatus Sulfidibacterium hydrothermale TaxID=2875962 RepID=UPI001F0B211E|nr:deoxyribose-phosphate aldolase [Candidatus Sulfidibacterium hydrothermale]UBM62749.1 deoxyribose-phosphate aldolase [Candidatus Sulfidibacterium hydrothermale]